MKKDDNLIEELGKKFDELFGSFSTEDDAPDVPPDTDDLDDLDDFDNTIILNDENGEEVSFEFLDLIVYDGEEYIILLPEDESEDAGEVVILKVEETDSEDDATYTSVDDEETLQTVFNIFKEKFKDEFNFID